MRIKRQIALLSKATELNTKIITNLEDRNLEIQEHIFNCHPYELEFKEFSIH